MDNANKTGTYTATDRQIRRLKNEAGEHGDLRLATICDLAIFGPDSLDGAEPGTEAAELLDEGRSQEWAREQCAAAIAYNEAR